MACWQLRGPVADMFQLPLGGLAFLLGAADAVVEGRADHLTGFG